MLRRLCIQQCLDGMSYRCLLSTFNLGYHLIQIFPVCLFIYLFCQKKSVSWWELGIAITYYCCAGVDLWLHISEYWFYEVDYWEGTFLASQCPPDVSLIMTLTSLAFPTSFSLRLFCWIWELGSYLSHIFFCPSFLR